MRLAIEQNDYARAVGETMQDVNQRGRGRREPTMASKNRRKNVALNLSSTNAKEAPQRMGINLITWNVQWCCGVDGLVDPLRIIRTAREMADFDVLCLQEVARNFPDLPGSTGEDQFAILEAALP